MKNCNVCGAVLSDDALFCGSCGSSLTESENSNKQTQNNEPIGTTVLNEQQFSDNSQSQPQNDDDFYSTTVLTRGANTMKPEAQPMNQQYQQQAGQPMNQQYQQQAGQPMNQQYQQQAGQPMNQQYQQQVGQPMNQQYQQQVGQPMNQQYSNGMGYVPQNGLFESFGLFWKNYANFDGRTRRADYWQYFLVNFLITLVASVFILLPILYYVLITLYSLAIFIPSLAIIVRRLHDIGKEWYNIFFILIPLAGPIILLVFLCTESEMGPNKFGKCPKLP